MFRFVSLGCDCQPAHQINLIQNASAAHFFDWLGSPIVGVSSLIGADFDGVLQAKNLHPYVRENIVYAVIDTKFGLDFSHDFSRLDQENIKRVQDIYGLRARWFADLFDEENPPTYFVRRSDIRDIDNSDDAAIRLLAQLQERRRDVRMLYLHDDYTRPPGFAPGFRSAYLPQPQPFHWHGLQPAWSDALKRVALEPYAGDGDAFPLPKRRPKFGDARTSVTASSG